MKSDRVYLTHILECIERVREATACGRDEFLASHIHQDAVLRNLQVLSESTQRISQKAKARYPEIEWKAVAEFRNVLVHEYLGVDLELILKIVRDDLPPLERTVRKMLEEAER